jgi:hypothetical protein
MELVPDMIRRAWLPLTALLVVCIACAYPVAGDAYAAGDPGISGIVTDEDHRPVPQTAVYLYSNGTFVNVPGNPAVTDVNGFYQFNNVKPEIYSLEASKNNYNVTATAPVRSSGYRVDFMLPSHTAALSGGNQTR